MSRLVSNNTPTSNATAAWAVLALLAAPGCSFLFSEGAPENHRALESFSCGESYVPPILDTVAAGLLGVEALATASSKSATVAKTSPDDQPAERHTLNVDIGVQAAFATIATAAAIYGYRAAGDCREARDTRLALVMRASVLPPPYGVPPVGEPPPLWPPPPMSVAAPNLPSAAVPAPPGAPPAGPAPGEVTPLPPATPSP
jgi:hypothetical protein